MRFRILGPLELRTPSLAESVVLGGLKQRTTLATLLLNANRVVATSQLLKALWADEEPPPSARKMLQNAVWCLRNLLGDGGPATLLTRAPGYVLRVDPNEVDFFVFNRLFDKGRAALAAGRPDVAAPLLHDALQLWRGPMLADLVEAGISWPELVTAQNARLNALEEYFEAQLACGRHHELVNELERTVEVETFRERLCGQLMIALYRCGRQSDALAVYARIRAALVEDLGLEPDRGLQQLQQAILTHAPELAPTGGPPWEAIRVPAPVAAEPPPPMERRQVSVVLIRAELGQRYSQSEAAEADEILGAVDRTIREHVECLGGTLAASIGPLSLALFTTDEAASGSGAGPVRAVRAACAVRDNVGVLLLRACGATLRIAVITGEALVRDRSDHASAAPAIVGTLLGRGQMLLAMVGAGELHVCDRTRELIGTLMRFGPAASPAEGWRVDGPWPDLGREHELHVLAGLLQRARHRGWPHLVTILGDPGVGKTRLLAEFACRLAQEQPAVRFSTSLAAPAAHVVVLDDLHLADDDTLDAVEGLAEAAGLKPLLVIAAARPELLERRPTWGGGKRHATVISLDPVRDTHPPRDDLVRRLAATWISASVRPTQPARPAPAEREPLPEGRVA